MFFSGDHSTRKRVDLGGRSSKERDRKVLLEQTRLERKHRLELKQQNNAAITIQKCFRGRKAAKHARSQIRIQFCQTFGDGCENVNKHCFNSDSDFLRRFLFFFTASNKKDLHLLVKICQLLLQFSELNGGVVSLFADKDYISKRSILEIRVKKLVYFCLEAVHHNRDNLKNQMLMPHEYNSLTAIILFQTVVQLANHDLPWACKVVDHLLHNKVYLMLRGILLTGLQITNKPEPCASTSSIEHVLILISSHTGQNLCTCSNIDLQWSFSFQLLSIPYFWRHFPHVKEVFTSRKLIMHYVHQIASCLPIDVNILPSVSPEFPGYACLIGNLLDAAGITLSGPDCSFLMAMDFVMVSTFLLESMPKLPSAGEMSIKSEDDMDEDPKETLDMSLLRQISNSIDSRLLQNLVNALFKHTLLISGSDVKVQSGEEVEAIYAICAFLHVTFNTLRVERIMTGLAYRTDLVPALWNYIKKCHENQKWPTCKLTVYVPGDSFGWLLLLTVFCPVYKHMLMIIDNEEFYEQEKPLSIKDIKLLVIILKQALWDLLWTIPGAGSVPLSQKPILKDTDHKKKASQGHGIGCSFSFGYYSREAEINFR